MYSKATDHAIVHHDRVRLFSFSSPSRYKLEEDLETVVIGFLHYHDALAFSMSCQDLLKKEHHIHHVNTVHVSTNQGLGLFGQLTHGSRALPAKSMRSVDSFQLVMSAVPDDRSSLSSSSSSSSTQQQQQQQQQQQEEGGRSTFDQSTSEFIRRRHRRGRNRTPSLSFAQLLPRLLKGFRFFFPNLIKLDLGK